MPDGSWPNTRASHTVSREKEQEVGPSYTTLKPRSGNVLPPVRHLLKDPKLYMQHEKLRIKRSRTLAYGTLLSFKPL